MTMQKEALATKDLLRVLVIEDHPIVRDGCKRIFQRRADMEMIEACSAGAGLTLNRDYNPHIVVLDIGLPDASGFDIISKLLDENKEVKIIIFSMYETLSFVTAAFEKGAKGYVTKNDDPNTILAAIDKVRSGSIYLGQAVAQSLALVNLSITNDPLQNLNDRERQIVAGLGTGKSLSEISVEMVLGYKTVANAIAAIKQKLQITTNAALIKFAVELSSKL